MPEWVAITKAKDGLADGSVLHSNSVFAILVRAVPLDAVAFDVDSTSACLHAFELQSRRGATLFSKIQFQVRALEAAGTEPTCYILIISISLMCDPLH